MILGRTRYAARSTISQSPTSTKLPFKGLRWGIMAVLGSLLSPRSGRTFYIDKLPVIGKEAVVGSDIRADDITKSAEAWLKATGKFQAAVVRKGMSFLPVRLQLRSTPARLPQMVAPARMTKPAEGFGVRLILRRGL